MIRNTESTPTAATDEPNINVAIKAEDVRQAIEDTLFGMATIPREHRKWLANHYHGLRQPSTDYHIGVLKADAYPGRGVIMPVARATIELGRHNRGDWTYSRNTETSHSGTGRRSWEYARCVGGLVTVGSFLREGYSRPTESNIQLSSSSPEDEPVIVGALVNLQASLAAYHQDHGMFHALDQTRFDSYRAREAAAREVTPLRHFGHNVLQLEALHAQHAQR